MERSSSLKPRIFWGVAVAIVVCDVVSKLLAHNLLPPRVPQPVLGQEWLRLTLVYNRGAAFGLHFGNDVVTRFAFIGLTLAALAILWWLYKNTQETDRWRVMAVALVWGGAIGNFIDRIRWSRGVVDFVDVGIGAQRWPTFNVADAAVSTGAFLLAIALWREEQNAAPEQSAVASSAPTVAGNSGEQAI